tara:strand:+ start:166 stop:603 length:438 start_codon:yes stop_codon:yes gene_type:complete
MNATKQILMPNINYWNLFFKLDKFRFILVFIIGIILFPVQLARSEEIFLTCTGNFEINRGELIKPDWETSYLIINLDGLTSSIDDKGIKKEGSTLIKHDSYTITHRDNNKRIKTKYKINSIYGTYIVEYPQRNRTLIGTCQKGRG